MCHVSMCLSHVSLTDFFMSLSCLSHFSIMSLSVSHHCLSHVSVCLYVSLMSQSYLCVSLSSLSCLCVSLSCLSHCLFHVSVSLSGLSNVMSLTVYHH
ncbi:unnamed protein product [Meloidogyne enterolobii]|uniref:Uncharacterized protein n=1 Tax=Meloidogyne enterolobii TaxID=390850 RepID=A0ACB0YMV9_MELEN